MNNNNNSYPYFEQEYDQSPYRQSTGSPGPHVQLQINPTNRSATRDGQQQSYDMSPSPHQSRFNHSNMSQDQLHRPGPQPYQANGPNGSGSEVWSDGYASTIQYDSRVNSEANLVRYGNGASTPTLYDRNGSTTQFSAYDNRISQASMAPSSANGSQINLFRPPRDSRNFGKPSSPNFSRVLGSGFDSKSQTLFARDWAKDGSIIKLSERDDIDLMPKWKRILFNLTPVMVIFSLATYWTYFVYRIICVMSAQRAFGKAYPMAWIFIGIEFSVAVPTFLHSFMTIFILNPRRRPKLRLTGDDVPDVDVFITCCKEETELVVDTARAACEVDYPPDRFRVVVLDDGRDVDLMEECELMRQTQYPNLYYMAREKIPGKPHHFKAGNLNYGFDEVAKLPGGPAPFAAALDADMIPEKQWLRAIMPHMLIDERMALACPPQLFYNVPKGDPLAQSLDFFVHVLEGIKDALGVAWCTGSGYVLRREALEEIGWFPLGSLAEDVATSTLMLGKGWKTAFIHEPLQFGTIPDSFGSHLKQRTRWAIGTVDTAVKLKFCLYGDAIRRMSFFQRLSGFIYAVLSVFNIFMAISLFAMPIVLISGKSLVAYATDNQLRWLIRLCFIALLTNRVTEFIMYLPSGYSLGQNDSRAPLWMSPYIAVTLVRAFVLPSWLGGQVQTFQPTGSLRSDLNERDAVLRAPLWTRIRVIVFNYMAWYHIVYAYFCLVAATLATGRCVLNSYDQRARLLCLLTHAFWPPVGWLVIVCAFWTPIAYAINPPTVPPREELLDRDPKTKVARPKEKSKKVVFGKQRTMFELQYSLTTGFTIFIFVAAFIWL